MSGRNLQDYIEVKDRIAEFWKRHPEGRVLTRVVEYSTERVLLFAEVYTDRDDARPVATGYAEEVRSDRGVNATSAVENGETSAIGRALANMGMTLSKNRASREEMQKVERMEHSRAGAEVAPGPAQHSAPPTDRPAAVPSAAGPPSPDNGKRVPTFAEARQYALDETISAKGRHRAATIALELAGSLDELADTYSKVMALPEREGLKETYETRHKALKELDAVPF